MCQDEHLACIPPRADPRPGERRQRALGLASDSCCGCWLTLNASRTEYQGDSACSGRWGEGGRVLLACVKSHMTRNELSGESIWQGTSASTAGEVPHASCGGDAALPPRSTRTRRRCRSAPPSPSGLLPPAAGAPGACRAADHGWRTALATRFEEHAWAPEFGGRFVFCPRKRIELIRNGVYR